MTLSAGRRVPAALRLFRANGQDQRPIHPQRGDCRPAGGCPPDYASAFPAEMVAPALAARVEEGHSSPGLGVDGRPAGFLTQ